jgi:hypothetical protein
MAILSPLACDARVASLDAKFLLVREKLVLEGYDIDEDAFVELYNFYKEKQPFYEYAIQDAQEIASAYCYVAQYVAIKRRYSYLFNL